LERTDGDQTLGDGLVDELTLAPDDATLLHEVDQLLEEWIATLTQREREVLEGRFGLHDHDPETLDSLSLRLGLTRERVRQVQNEALLKLKRYLGRRGITRHSVM
jgi:RNA polymerase nonessential primary-like sigma factor